MKKAVFFDIDGTLWDRDMRVPKSCVSAIRRLREKGNYAFLCSGRSRAAIQGKELLEDIGFDGILAGCGTYGEYQGEIVFERKLSQQEIGRLLAGLKKYRIPAILEGKKYLYANKEEFGEDPYLSYLDRILKYGMLPLSEYQGRFDANKISADYTRGDAGGLCRELSADFEFLFHETRVVEIMPKGYSKASGIRRMCSHLNIAHEDTYAFGDSANDIAMLQYVKHGVAMGNAAEDVKAAADYVTSDLFDDGIQHGLEYFSLI